MKAKMDEEINVKLCYWLQDFQIETWKHLILNK